MGAERRTGQEGSRVQSVPASGQEARAERLARAHHQGNLLPAEPQVRRGRRAGVDPVQQLFPKAPAAAEPAWSGGSESKPPAADFQLHVTSAGWQQAQTGLLGFVI